MMLERTDEADGNNRDAELLCDAKATILKSADGAIARALCLRKNNQASATVNRILRQAPHAFEVGGTANIGHGHIPKALHQPAVGRDPEVRFEFPAADILWNGAVQNERIKEIDVIDHEEAGALRIEARGAVNFNAGAGKISDAAAETPLQPVVLAGIKKDAEEHESRSHDEKVQDDENPDKPAAQRQ